VELDLDFIAKTKELAKRLLPTAKGRRRIERAKKKEENRKAFFAQLELGPLEVEQAKGQKDFFHFATAHLENLAYDFYFHGLIARFIEHGESRTVAPGDYYWPSRADLIKADGEITAEYRIGDGRTLSLKERLRTEPTNLDGSFRGFFIRISPDKDAKYKQVLVPRGHLKTTFCTVGKFLWLIIRNPFLRQLLVMNSSGNSGLRVREMKAHFELNDRFREIWRSVVPDFLFDGGGNKPTGFVWKQDAFDVKKPERTEDDLGQQFLAAEMAVFGSGIATRKTSQHYPYIHYDDVVDEKVVTSKEQIEKNIQQLVESMDLSIGDTTKFFGVGTCWHYADVWQQMHDPKELGWTDLNCLIATVEDYEGEPLYPANEFLVGHPGMTKRKIHEKKTGARTSIVFPGQQLMQPVSEQDQKFPPGGWKWYREADLAENHSTVLSIDPAISTEGYADYTAYCVITVDHMGYWYVRELLRVRGIDDFEEQVYALNDRYRFDMVGVEGTGFQRTLEATLRDAHMTRGRAPIPTFRCTPSTRQSKEYRISRIIPRFNSGMILLPAGCDDELTTSHQRNAVADGFRHLIEEGERFPKSRHDDCLDALSQAIEFAWQPGEIKKKQDESPNARLHRRFSKFRARQGRRKPNRDEVLGIEGVDW